MGLKEYTLSLIFIGLFSIALISFAINFASDNSASVSIADSDTIGTMKNEINSNLSSWNTESESSYQSITQSSITQADTTPSGGQFTLTVGNSLNVVKSIVRNGFVVIFGNDEGFAIFLSTFIGILVLLFGYYIWKAWAGRSVE
jgi:hypothetical protein